MDDLVHEILGFIQQHQGWTGPVLFVVSFGESLAVVSLFVPGTAVLVAAGALIPLGMVDPVSAVLWSVPGAIVGDTLSYWIGRRFARRLSALWPFSRHIELLPRGEAFFRRYGGWSVALGRFFGPVRAVIPLTAGCMNMAPGSFQLANILSALVWSPSLLLVGALAGTALRDAQEPTLIGLAILAMLALLVWAARRWDWVGRLRRLAGRRVP